MPTLDDEAKKERKKYYFFEHVPPIFSSVRIMKTNVFSTNTQLRFVSVILKCVLGNPHLSQNISKVEGVKKFQKNAIIFNVWPHIENSHQNLGKLNQ